MKPTVLFSTEGKSLSTSELTSTNIHQAKSASERAKHIFAIVGELKTLSCSVHARPYPDFKWLHLNGTLIQNKTDFIIQSYEDSSSLTVNSIMGSKFRYCYTYTNTNRFTTVHAFEDFHERRFLVRRIHL
jgi:hypothetical protein